MLPLFVILCHIWSGEFRMPCAPWHYGTPQKPKGAVSCMDPTSLLCSCLTFRPSLSLSICSDFSPLGCFPFFGAALLVCGFKGKPTGKHYIYIYVVGGGIQLHHGTDTSSRQSDEQKPHVPFPDPRNPTSPWGNQRFS